MAQLKDLIVTGNSKFIGNVLLDHDPTVDLEAATKHYIDSAIDSLPAPMQFKGSLGTGGTITALPAAAASNTGFTYKVITQGTYVTGETAKVGDMYISNGAAWVLIPSGDDIGGGGTVTSIEFTQGSGIALSVTPENPITSSGTVTIAHGDTSTQASVNNSGRTYIQDITLDDYGHVTALSSATETVVDTDSKYALSGALASHKYTSTLTASGSSSGTSTSDITFAEGSNISLSDNTSTRTITISASDTTYTFANGTNGFTVTPSGGSAQTVTVTPSITNNITGSGTSEHLAKFSGANTLTDGPALDTTDSTKHLVHDGTWSDTAYRTAGIPYGQVDSTSTSTAFTATIPGITELRDGVCMWLKNGVVTSASGFTININGLGAKPSYSNMAAATADTTLFNVNYTFLFVYDSTRVSGGCWVCYRGYNSDNNTVGYQIRYNSANRLVTDTARYYKIYFSSADNLKWVPASVNSTNNATAARTVNQRPINPFGEIVYTSASTNYTAGSALAAATAWVQYNLALGYSFNRTGAALTLTTRSPVYVKCAPQADGSAIIDANTPYVQALPSSADGKIYIYLGIASSATAVEMTRNHTVYYYKAGEGIRIWTGSEPVTATDLNEYIIEIPHLTLGMRTINPSGGDTVAAAVSAGKKIIAKVHAQNLAGITTGTTPYIYVPMTGADYLSYFSQWRLSFEIFSSYFTEQDGNLSYLSTPLDLGAQKYKLVITCAAADSLAYELTRDYSYPFVFELPNTINTSYSTTITNDSVNALRQAIYDKREIKIRVPTDKILYDGVDPYSIGLPVIYLSQSNGWYFPINDDYINLVFSSIIPIYADAASFTGYSILTIKLTLANTPATGINASECICAVTLQALPTAAAGNSF